MTTAAAVATATEKIKVGTFIVILPYQHPVLLAEEVANVDILSNGRFEFGVGQVIRIMNIQAFCMNRAERGPKTRESIRLIERLFKEEKVTHQGKFFQTLKQNYRRNQYRNPIHRFGLGDAARKR